MSTLQQQIKDAVTAVGSKDIVAFHNKYGGRLATIKPCIGIAGSLSECMLVVGHVIKEMAHALSEVAATGTPIERCDTEHLFDQNVNILLNYSIGLEGYRYIIYWPSLEPIK